ncbi:MAG: hypothetical protein ACPKPY_10995 [Nitrososphaeraceae archaeon]
MLKTIISSSQSALGTSLVLYQIKHENQDIWFIHNTYFGSSLIHYFISNITNTKKYVELNKLTGKYEFCHDLGNTPNSIYIPILKLLYSTLKFPK